ncbi:hypothetical protein CGCTS75_v013436 [Colletotrichum tropicale]|nr:hypothetical protein CGCTS75_v013436 [Colletotrichum tropicale]
MPGIKQKPKKPHLIVGIDFGLTGTAVAWALPSKDTVVSMKNWDGLLYETGKVPSAVVLHDQNGQTAWGFSALESCESPQYPVYSLFKAPIGMSDCSAGNARADSDTNGDEPQNEDPTDSHADADEDVDDDFQPDQNIMNFPKAKACLTVYLEGLYAHIKKVLSKKLPTGINWKSMHAWFLFSYPTTWSPTAKDRFNEIVKSSGFGQEQNHWVDASYMDEAQAAMAFFSLQGSRPTPESVILIADIGGGTTDVNTYVVQDDDGKKVKLKVETDATGREYGSVHIDSRIINTLRVEAMKSLKTSQNTAYDSMSLGAKRKAAETEVASFLGTNNYRLVKHSLDYHSATGKMEKEKLPLYLPSSRAAAATLKFRLDKILHREFEEECQKIWSQIEEHSRGHLVGRMSQLVFTGGMTKNAFVRHWFDDKVQKSPGSSKPEVIFLSEPELAVSRGLVHDAIESYKRDGLWLYKSLHSYGIVVYNTDGEVETKRKFLAKGRVIDPKKFREKQTIRFKSGADLRLARWDQKRGKANNDSKGKGKNKNKKKGEDEEEEEGEDNESDDDDDKNGIRTICSLTTSTTTPTEWDQSRSFGCNAKTEVELSFERQTAIVAFWSKGKQEHRQVFNEEWHSGAASKSKRNLPSFANLARIGQFGLGVLAVITSIIVGFDLIPQGDQGSNDANGRDGIDGAKNTPAQDNGDDGGTEEGVGQFDDFAE